MIKELFSNSSLKNNQKVHFLTLVLMIILFATAAMAENNDCYSNVTLKLTTDNKAAVDVADETSISRSYVDVDVADAPPIWPNPNHIPVCWEPLDEPNQYQDLSPVQPTFLSKAKVARAVKEQYARAGIGFVGWGKCKTNSKGIRVKIKYFQGSSRTDGFGRNLNGIRNGMTLNWAVKDDAENDIPASARIVNTALHEFGHALGLHHEMARPDSTDCFEKDYTMGLGELGSVQSLGDYLPNSIMSYCRDFSALKLAEGDIQRLINYYNDPIAAIVGGPRGAVNLTDVEFSIGGYEIEGYRYKMGSASAIDCNNPLGYSEEQHVANSISASLVPFGDGPVKLCVVGKDVNSEWQSYDGYTSWYWIQDRTPPAPTAVNRSEDDTKLVLYLDGEGIVQTRIKVGHAADCSDPEGYGYKEDYRQTFEMMGEVRTITYPINIDLLSDAIDHDKDLTVCIVAIDEAHNVQSFARATEYVHLFNR
jgi:hypothetical protein